MNPNNAYKSSLLAGFLAALGGTACCFGPLLLVTIGLGGAWVASLRALEAYQPLFIVLTLGFVGVAFYRLYVAPRRCAPGDVCALPAVLRRQRIIFWITLALIAVMFALPLFLALPFFAPLFY